VRYAIFVPADQTICYLSEGYQFTTKHPEAALFKTLEEAHLAWTRVQQEEGHTAPLVPAGPTADAGAHGGYVEEVPDTEAFRKQEDTW
jgi:hypothetical protein